MEKKIIIFWICNEFLQGTLYFYNLKINFYLVFFIVHLSSFCAGYLFTRLFKKYNLERFSWMLILLQLAYNLVAKNSTDLFDVLFLILGIALALYQEGLLKKLNN